jgi:hypothetical protein
MAARDATIHVWDSISDQVKPVVDNQEYPNPIGDGNIIGGMAEAPIDRDMGGWSVECVADYPGGIRVVTESDGRNHAALWLTVCP